MDAALESLVRSARLRMLCLPFTNRVESDNTLGPQSHGVGPCSEGWLKVEKSALQSTPSTAGCPACGMPGCHLKVYRDEIVRGEHLLKGLLKELKVTSAHDSCHVQKTCSPVSLYWPVEHVFW